MDKFDLRNYLIEGKLYENELEALGKELANALEDEFEEKKDLKEVAGLISSVLAATTLTNILSKYVGRLFKKYNFGKV